MKSATLPGEPQINTLLRFEYNNRLSVPIYIPQGEKNQLFGDTYFVGEPPEVFYPGVHTFDIYTDGEKLQWKVTTDNCWWPSKSPKSTQAHPLW